MLTSTAGPHRHIAVSWLSITFVATPTQPAAATIVLTAAPPSSTPLVDGEYFSTIDIWDTYTSKVSSSL